MNKIPIKLYYKEDGAILNQGGLNKIPLLTKLSNYVYELILVTPLINTEYTLYAIFEKSDGTITSPYPMDYYGTEIVKVGNQQQRWYKYKTILDSDVLNISTLNYNNQIKIGFRAEFNSGEVDEQTNESIVGVFNFIPTSAYCSYTINSRNVVIDNTPLKTIIDFINTGNAGKLDKSESILLTDVEPTLITDEGSAYYNLNYLYFFTSDTQNYKKGEIAKHTLNDNGQSVLEKIPLYESVYSKYDDTQKGSTTPRSIGERFGDVTNNLNLLHQTKVDKVEGKQLSTNDFTDAYKNKLETLDENIGVDLESTKTELKTYTDTKIADLINGSPETLDTLKELADAYQNNLDIINSLIAVLGNKANASDVYTKTQIDNALQNKVDKVNGKSLVLDSEIQKLKTVEYNANHYVLPSDVPHDSNYVHTDNNFTNTEKQKLQALKNYDDSGIKQQINNVEANAKQYTNEQINELIGGASDSYNTLKELQDAFTENKDLIANLNDLASKKVDKVDGKGLSTNDFTNEDKDILKYSPKPLYNKDYNYNSDEIIMGAINYTHENGLKSKMFIYDGNIDNLILVINRWSNYYEAIQLFYLHNEKVVYNIVQAPVADTSLIVEASRGQIVETGGSGSGGSGSSVDLEEVKSYIDEELGKIVDNAPEALNTLNELATAYTEQGEVVEALNSAINNKVDKVEGKQLSSNDYTDYDMEKVNIIPISIPYAGSVSGAIKEALNYMKLNNLMFLSAIYDNDFTTKIKIYQSGPSGWGTLAWSMEYKSANLRYDSNNLVTYDTPVEEITYTPNQIIPIPTKTSELENDSGFVTKNIIPNELNSKFAISSSTEDLTANTIKTRIDIGTSFIVRSMAYGNDTYVAVGQYANMRYLYKNSPTWGECDISYHSTSSTFTSITYGKGMFVCVEYYEENEEKNSILHKSLNGIEWEQVHHFNFGIENIIYANGRFILVGSQGYIAFTDDLITFTPTNSKIENDIISVAYGKNRYVAVSNKGDILYSLDGVVWNIRSIPNDTTHYRVATYGKGMFVIGGQNGTIRYSYDGISWNTAIVNSNLKSINYIRAMCYYNGKFFACLYGSGASGTDGEILTSVDGINWTSDLVDETNRLWSIGYGNDVVLIGGDNGAIHKYNLYIEWLDYEPVIKANEVLWQKQFLTLSDGSIVESEVEVHTNMKNIYDATLNGNIVIDENIGVGSPLAKLTVTFNTYAHYSSFPFDKENRYVALIQPDSSGNPGIYTYYINNDNEEIYQINTFMYYGGPAYPVDAIFDSRYGWLLDKYSFSDSTTSNIGKLIDNYQDLFGLTYQTISLKETLISTANIAKNNKTSIQQISSQLDKSVFPFASSKLVENNGNPVFFDELKNYLLELKDNPIYYNNSNQFHKFTLSRQGMNYDAIIYTGTNEEDNIGMVDYLLIIANGDIFKAYPIKDENNNVIDFEFKTLGQTSSSTISTINTKFAISDNIAIIPGEGEWLDSEPVLQANEVLWEKQIVTMSDGSSIESEPEVHTNMKNIYDVTIYGKSDLEYEIKRDLNLNNKTIIFNKNFTPTTDGVIFDARTNPTLNENDFNEYKKITINCKYGDIYINQYHFFEEFSEEDEFLYNTENIIIYDKNTNEWLQDSFSFDKDYPGYTIYDVYNLEDNIENIIKIIEPQKSVINTISKNKNFIDNLPIQLKATMSEYEIGNIVKKAFYYGKENNLLGNHKFSIDSDYHRILSVSYRIDDENGYQIGSWRINNYESATKQQGLGSVNESTPESDIEYMTLNTFDYFDCETVSEYYEEYAPYSIENCIRNVFNYSGGGYSDFFKCRLLDDRGNEQDILISMAYFSGVENYQNDLYIFTAISSYGVNRYRFYYDENWNEIIEEIKESIPTKEELVQSVIEALPKYNGEVIE